MSSETDDFDPTRALDGWQVRQERGLPDLDLDAVVGRARRAALEPERLERLRRRGFVMNDIEDLEVLIHRPAPEDAPPQGEPEPCPRLLPQWQSGCWSVCARRVLGACNELRLSSSGPKVESHGPQWLLAFWPPGGADSSQPSRWPAHVMLLEAVDARAAAAQWLALLPGDELLWLGEFDVDWALIADVLLQHEPRLRPFQGKALRDFSAAEKLAQFKRIQSAYEPAAEGRPLRRKSSEF